MTTARIGAEDQRQMQIIGRTKFQYNTADELIFIRYEYAGEVYLQSVEDDDYTGGTTAGAIVRTKTFNQLGKQ